MSNIEQGGTSMSNTGKFNWGEALKVEIKASPGRQVSDGGQRQSAPIPVGRYAANIREAQPTTFKSGSFGLKFVYLIESGEAKGRKVSESLVLTKADGTPVAYANERLKLRLMAGGLSLEEIHAFKGPRNEHDLGDFKKLFNSPVTIIVADGGEYEGRPTRKVKAVYARNVE